MGSFNQAESLSWAVVDGKAPPLVQMPMPCAFVFIHSVKPSASSWLLPPFGSAKDEPPLAAVACWPAAYCGMGATRHLPTVSFTDDSRMPGHQAPEIIETYVPLFRFLNQPSDQPGVFVSTNLPWTSWSQTETHFAVPGSLKLILMLVPSTVYGWPPACQIIDVVKPASPPSLVMYAFGSAALSFL